MQSPNVVRDDQGSSEIRSTRPNGNLVTVATLRANQARGVRSWNTKEEHQGALGTAAVSECGAPWLTPTSSDLDLGVPAAREIDGGEA